MGIFDNIGLGNWVKWNTKSVMTIETSFFPGVTEFDPLTRTCPLCVAVNQCYFVDDSLHIPKQPMHENCKCLTTSINGFSVNQVKLGFPIGKITGYLFTNDSKKGVVERMGYTINDAQEVYDEIVNQSKINYANGNYELGELKIAGGQNIKIPCVLKGKGEKSDRIYHFYNGWGIYPNGKIKHYTPFDGWVD